MFTIGLGLAQVTLPEVMSSICGIDSEDSTNRSVMRLLGLREIVCEDPRQSCQLKLQAASR